MNSMKFLAVMLLSFFVPNSAYASMPDTMTIEKLIAEEMSANEITAPGKFFFSSAGITPDEELPFYPGEMTEILDSFTYKEADIASLNELAGEITKLYREKGFLAATAYLPEQSSPDGWIEIKVAAGKFERIEFENESRLSDDVLADLSSFVHPGDVATENVIENVLYRINNLGGVKAAGKLLPGSETGTTVLHIRVIDDLRERSIVYSDNYGNDYSGKYRFGGLFDFYNIDNRGSQIELGAVLSNKDFYSYAFRYEMLAGTRTAAKWGINLSRADYDLSGEYRFLKAHGISEDYSVYGKIPLDESINSGLDLSFGYKRRNIKEDFSAFSIDDKKHSDSLYLTLGGHRRFFKKDREAKAVLDYSLSLTGGRLENESEFAKLLGRANDTEGNFVKAEGRTDYRHNLDKRWDFHTALSWQFASKPLDGSEEFYLGGPYGVRAYDNGDGNGDEGYLISTEFLYKTGLPGLTLGLFYDAGGTRHKLYGGYGSLQGFGLEASFTRPNDYFLRLDYARAVGGYSPLPDGRDKDRFWFIAGKIF